MGKSEEEFRQAIEGKNVPVLVLDQKWHRLFAIHGKTDKISALEKEVNELLVKQGKLNTDIKKLKARKAKLMDNVVMHMEGADEDSVDKKSAQQLENDRQMIDETNALIEEYEDELMDIPRQMKEKNEDLMLESMDYIYEKLRVNTEEAKDIEEWIAQVRIDLKKNIIRKQNREINNREMYSYIHDIFGPEIVDIFDLKYEKNQDEEES